MNFHRRSQDHLPITAKLLPFGKAAIEPARRPEPPSQHVGIVQKVLDLSVVFDDLWYAKMTFGES